MSIADFEFMSARRLPIIVAAEAAECGLACLTMVARYHGHDVDLNGLRQRFTLSMSGATLRAMIAMADDLSLSARPLRVEIEYLKDAPLPVILHWGHNHFVVLRKVAGRSFVIHDPSIGVKTLSYDEFSKHFTGVLLEFTKVDNFSEIHARTRLPITSLWSRSTGAASSLLVVLGLSVALQVATFVAPFQIQLVVDEAIGRADEPLLHVLALGFFALVIVQTSLDAVRTWAIQVLGNLFTYQLVGNLFRHLLRLPADFFEKRSVGDILSRLASTTAIQDALSRGIVAALMDGVLALVAAVILFFYSPLLAGVVLASVALTLLVNTVFFPLNRARAEEQLVANATERTHIMESVRAAATIKVMGREAERIAAWRNLYSRVINSTISVARLQINANWIQGIIVGGSTVLVIYLGARKVLSGDGLSIGMLLAFLSFRQTFGDRAVSLINQGVQFSLLGLHLERLSDIVTATPDVLNLSAPDMVDIAAIHLRNVSFRYGDSDPWILRDFSLSIEPGEFVAIVGPSGCGKSTLLKLMLGLRSPTAGHVELGERKAGPELWRAWRDRVGFVAQDDQLLSGSIAENIAFFDPDLDMAKVRLAATNAQIHDDIEKMPMKYLSLVGDMGAALSGGQRQRILLARAFYREPAVLVLDEGTANLDVDTEEVIANLVVALPITRIVVAHRPALIAKASRVVDLRERNEAIRRES